MPRSSEALALPRISVPAPARRLLQVDRKDPRVIVRLAVAVLLALNMVAALIVLKPWGGSPEDLAREMESLRQQVQLRQAALQRTRALVAKVEKARAEGDRFLGEFVMNRRTASSAIVSELDQMAKQAGFKQKEAAFGFEPIDGSDTLSMMTVAAGYEGSYQSLTHFVNLLDKSPRFLIVESLQASPQQSGAVLNVMLKFNGFVREEAGSAPAASVRPASQGATP